MGLETVTAFVSAVTALCVPVGGGVAWLAAQNRRRRMDQRDEMDRLEAKAERYRRTAEQWRAQLYANGLTPIPPDYPEGD